MAAATLGTAAAVPVSGLIGFVGIIVPHTVRLTSNASYRVVIPVSMIGGAAFLILADVAARNVQVPERDPHRRGHGLRRGALLLLPPPFPSRGPEHVTVPAVITFEGVTVRYGRTPLLRASPRRSRRGSGWG